MISRFFIHRPIFAAVISILIVFSGLMTLRSLPVAQYPEIAPPTVLVTTNYPGASAKVLSDTVAQPLEEQVNGVDGMLYMSSTSNNNGDYSLTVTFEVGTDLDMAQVLVQNRVARAEASLPLEVQRMGINVEKQSNAFLMLAALTSPEGSFDEFYLSNYAHLYLKNALTRLEGVGSVMVFGASEYSMRIWLNPDQMQARGVTTTDVISAIQEQNIQVAAGQIGQPPMQGSQNFQYALNVKGRLKETAEFEDIIIKNSPDDGMVRVRDIARVDLGVRTYDVSSQSSGIEGTFLGFMLKPGANALEVSQRVKSKLSELSQNFPRDLVYDIPFDTTPFVESSIDEVVETLYIAVVLVAIVILLFLQSVRAALIPIITIPVSLIGTFTVMAVLDVSINMLSLFGLVLAIGIVVDDAIVVVENVSRNINETGLSPKKATIKAMEEVTGPIIATTLVLMAVFLPTAFVGGVTGQLYRQFALTIATATVFSSINALTLSPALSSILLKPSAKKPNLFSRGFNFIFGKLQSAYGTVLAGLVRRSFVILILFVGISSTAYWGFNRLPKGFLPIEDQGWAMMAVQLPDGASLQRTREVVNQINARVDQIEGIKQYSSVSGFSLMDNTNAANAATLWITFDPWEDRLAKGLTQDAILGQLWGVSAQIQEALIFAFAPPPILGLGTAGGFEMQIQDRGNLGLDRLQSETDAVMMLANQHRDIQQAFSTFRANVPQLEADVDRTQTKSLDIQLSDLFETLQANLGSVYVNDFNQFGRTYQVRVQADSKFRSSPEQISRLEVRNKHGEMIPLGTMVDVSETLGPQIITRYNMYPSARLNGQGGPGVSSGVAMDVMEEIAGKNLLRGMGFEWTGMSFQEKSARGQTVLIFTLAVIIIYLVLCAQYESWTLPVSIVLAVPLAVLGTVVAVTLRGMEINVYTQLGIVLLIALTCKTSILIAEFAKVSRASGQSIFNAAFNAATLRFRPILMTAATFILGVFPLVIATGAGAAGRQALGTAVFSGMISATLLLIFFVPGFYYLIQRISEKASRSDHAEAKQADGLNPLIQD